MNSFLVSYSKFCNNKYSRKGGLFQKPFKRIEITDEIYLQQAIIYVNANAQKHGIIKNFKKYKWNAYGEMIEGNPRYINISMLLDFFHSRQKFIDTHANQVAYYYANDYPHSKLE